MKKTKKGAVRDRKCFVLREVEVRLGDLVRGDIFRLEPGSPADSVNVGYHEYSIAEDDAMAPRGKSPFVRASFVSFVSSRHPRMLNFGKA